MTIKDLMNVFGNIEVAIYRSVYNTETGDMNSYCLHSGLASKIPDMVKMLNVESAEPTANGLNIDVETMVIGKEGV